MSASMLRVGVREGTYTCALVRLHARVADMAVANSSWGALEERVGEAGCRGGSSEGDEGDEGLHVELSWLSRKLLMLLLE